MSGVCLLIIDPQNDFCEPGGKLFVDGAVDDMRRLSAVVEKHRDIFSNIVVTLDFHKYYHIAHSLFWVDKHGVPPKELTCITLSDVVSGLIKAANPLHQELALSYLTTLEETGRYLLTIWPTHCIIGTHGSNICDPMAKALRKFEELKRGGVDYLSKSSNSFTEHYSALKAEVPVLADKETTLNKKLLAKISEASKVVVAGEALSHCVANTILDLGAALNGDLKKFILLRDACSPVKCFESFGDSFIEAAEAMGMKISDCENFKSYL